MLSLRAGREGSTQGAAEKLLILMLLLFAMGSVSVILLGGDFAERQLGDADTRSSPALAVAELLIYAGCGLFMLVHRRRMFQAVTAAWPALLLVALALASSTWSVDPAVTLRRSGVLLATTVSGIYLGGRYTTQQFTGVLKNALLLMLAASLLLRVVLPAYVVDATHATALRGLTQHKNIFGEYMGILVLLALTHNYTGPSKFARLGTTLLALAALLASQSGTSVLATAGTLALLPLLLLLRFKVKQIFPLCLLAWTALAVFVSRQLGSAGDLLDLLGKDRTLTGRAEIWQMVLVSIGRRPWLGYGFNAFWQGLNGESQLIVAATGWNVPHSHNGYLETLLGLGIIGMVLMSLCALRLGWYAAIYVRQVGGFAGLWPFAFLTYFLLHAVTEASLLTRDGLSYLVFVVLSTSLALEHKARVSVAIEASPGFPYALQPATSH